MMNNEDLIHLAEELDNARAERHHDLDRLTVLDEDQIEYLAKVDELPDPETFNMESERCP